MKAIACVTLLVIGCTGSLEDVDAGDAEADDDPGEVDRVAALMAGAADGAVGDADTDHDGITDALEETLLRRYRPYFKFASNETYRPANPLVEAASAQLKTFNPDDNGTSDALDGCGRASDHHLDPPEQLFTCRKDTSYVVAPIKSTYCLNLDNTRYAGASWSDAQAKATGLYGHVTRTKLDGHATYKIEYWQFFAFNNQDISVIGYDSFADHEGDWTGVELWFDLELHRLVKTRYMIHGKSISFAIPQTPTTCRNCMQTIKGSAYTPAHGNFFDDPRAYDNQQAEFFIDERGYKHVAVYIERGGHEFWPGAWGKAEFSVGPISFSLNPHDGAGPSYLVPDIQDRLFNLGELDHPLTRAGKLVTQYNGLWGCTNTKELSLLGPWRRSPVGPALHCGWNRPGKGPIPGCSG
jgi:hypothetical protein